MMAAWMNGLLRMRGPALLASASGVAVAVALLALLGLFVANSVATMTVRAVSVIAPDWQVQLQGTTDVTPAIAAITETQRAATLETVDYADVESLTANTGGTTQTTGAGKAVGLDTGYRLMFPRQFRLLAGSFDGVLLAQQTAANLHAAPGDQVVIGRLDNSPVSVTIAGIVEMPSADQFFQVVGVTGQAVPIAPPDNIILLDSAKWRELFETQLETLPQTAFRQVHASFDHAVLPGDPVAAYVEALAAANNLSARLAGEGIIANNLAVRLDGVRLDALFAKVLFMFLGVPGAIVAVLLTMLIVLSGTDRRRQEIALLQMRGATPGRSIAFAGLEALMVGVTGAAAGLAIAWLVAVLLLALPAGWASLGLYVGAALCGIGAAFLIFLVPAIAAVQRSAIQNLSFTDTHDNTLPAWKRLWLDLALLVIAAIVFWQTSATGYQVVAAPEGVATAVVDYKAYLTPGLLWIGLALLLLRLCTAFMAKGKVILRMMLMPLAKRFSGIVTMAMSRDRARIAKGVVLVALAFSFAVSTAIFNSTYEQQARVDAALTNGADVAVTGTALDPASSEMAKIASIPGIAWTEPMQHRFAYVGTDLQDLYGIDAATIGKATAMSDAYFADGHAKATLARLRATPDGVLVSDETVTDFQLQPGDRINLRLQSGKDHAFHAVPFTFIGVVREFPTAPTDSFLVANASYVAEATGNDSAETVLVKTAGDPATVAGAIRSALGDGSVLKVTDIGETARRIGSSLVAVDLHGLTALELFFALPIIAGAVGLVFALGLEERRRNFAILLALGAKARHLGAFLWSEALVVYVAGLVSGLAIGITLAWVLVKMMTHVFDPPPEALAIPWLYLALLALVGLAAVCASVMVQLRKRAEPLSFALRKF
jgi:putative ABC transport system permease protein